MQRTLHVLGSVLLAALFTVSAQAACGGGGYQVVKESKSEAVRERVNAQYVETTRSDRVTEGDRQSARESSTTKRENDGQMERLRSDVAAAQRKLDNCDGNCKKERRRLEEAKARLNAFEAQTQQSSKPTG